MAIYHFNVTILSRARGHRIVASAAAQAAGKLRDRYYGILHNHERRPGVDFTEILAPDDAPPWVYDREQLWNRVEAAEHRKDSQLARAIEISLPVELSHQERVDLLRDYIRAEFVAKGMVADIGIRRTKLDNPNAHVLLTLRAATPAGFGPKVRQWNGRRNLLAWRASWAERANLHLARAGHPLRIDHRTLDEQQIQLTPSRRTGMGHPLQGVEGLPDYLRARFVEQRRIAHGNGAAIIEDPAIAIRALACQRRTFTEVQISQFLRSRADGEVQHEATLKAVMASSELIAVSSILGHPSQYTSRDLIEAEKSLLRRALSMAGRRSITGAPKASNAMSMTAAWQPPLRDAFAHLVGAGDFKAVALPADDVIELLRAARVHWHAQGRRVLDGIPRADDDALTQEHVLIVCGAEMIDIKALQRILAVAQRARSKLVLIADSVQLLAMGALSPMQGLIGVGRNVVA